MDYHLHQQGQTVGIFPLEELRRRRQAGELTGTELVWCPGMVQWQPLDGVLQSQTQASASTPPLSSARAPNKIPAWVIVGIIIVGLVFLSAFGIGVYQFIRGFRLGFRQAVSRRERPARESALTEASKPIVWTTNTLTMAKMSVKKREFRVRQYLDGYEKYSDHNPAYDTDALQMLKTWIDTAHGGPLHTNNAVIVEMCNKLAANPACDDPLVLTVTAVNAVELHEAARRLELALNGYEHSRYKAYPRLYATVMLAAKVVDLRRDSRRVTELDYSAKRLLKEALQDGSIEPEDQAELAEILITGWGSGFLARNGTTLPPIVEAAGKQFQWLALMLEGEHQIHDAWEARGNGYANTVTPEGWKNFYAHLARARTSFTRAWALRPDLPLCCSRMMTVSLGQSDLHEMRLWFDRAVAIQVDYPGVWNSLRWGLRPRWFGNLDSVLAFGVSAANTRRYDTDVPRKLFDSIADLEADLELPTGEHIYGRADVWPHLQQMYEGYVAEPSRASEQAGWRSTYSIIAYLAGKYDVSRTQLEAINWEPRRWNLTGWGRDLSLMPLEVAARTSPVAGQIDAAESASHAGSLAKAVRMYTELSAATNTDERTRSFIRERLTTLAMEERLQKGQWVDFLPTGETLPGWAVERGQFTALPDGALEVHSDQGGHMLYSRARVGNEFEVRGTFEVVRSSTTAFQAGLVMGLPEFETPGWYYGFRVKRNTDEGDVASFAEGWSTRQIYKPATINSGTNTFYFRFQRGLVSATVNDQKVFENAKPPELRGIPKEEMLVGLGAFNDTNETVIRYRNVQIRKL
jgi:hypothetical protein